MNRVRFVSNPVCWRKSIVPIFRCLAFIFRHPLIQTKHQQSPTPTNSPSSFRSMSKPKARSPLGQHAGVYKADTIKDVAESILVNISDQVASALASDVEYRLHQVIEEAARFMRHGRRTTMSTADIDHALRVLNIEPLYGHSPYNPSTFRRTVNYPPANLGVGAVYFVEDEEIDFDRVLREEKITLPRGVSWTAHWLAVEGVQPLIPENPPAIPRPSDQPQTESKLELQLNGLAGAPGIGPVSAPGVTALVNGFPGATGTGPTLTPVVKKQQQQQQQLVKQVLSRELQLYYTRLTTSLLPPSTENMAKRTAALASLRNDAGLQALLPYLIRWVGEGVVGALKEGVQSESDGRVLEVMLDVIGAILDNNTLFVEPYVSHPVSMRYGTIPNDISTSCTKSFLPSCQPFCIPLFLQVTLPYYGLLLHRRSLAY
ncbi:hypothetical protein AX15_005884 [Amanita polypyramis BW_CC]|nr:hypothetical protein AX15_005884 [Amanita polypyramis BW_CC]